MELRFGVTYQPRGLNASTAAPYYPTAAFQSNEQMELPSVWMWELDRKESWAPKNWCFWTVVLEKTLESPLDSKETKLVRPKGNQSWIFTGRTDAEAETPILWPPDAGKDWKQKKGMTEDEMVGWYDQLDGNEFDQAPG